MSAVQAFFDIPTPLDAFVTRGHLIALVGLLGLYPVLAHGRRRLARAAGAAGAVALLSWFVMTVVRFFELARERAYYDTPRRVSGSDLADELELSKATLHEHLRKVESKLLGPN